MRRSPIPTALPLTNWYPTANAAPVVVNGQIWMVMNTVDTGTGRGSIHWLHIDAANTAIIEEGYIGDATQSFVFPSIAANHDGDVVIGFNAVGPGPGQFASSYAVVGKTAGRKTVFGDRCFSSAGAPAISSHRCGCRELGRLQPHDARPEDDKTFWTIQQVAVDTTHWATQITALPHRTLRAAGLAIPCAGGKRRSTRSLRIGIATAHLKLSPAAVRAAQRSLPTYIVAHGIVLTLWFYSFRQYLCVASCFRHRLLGRWHRSRVGRRCGFDVVVVRLASSCGARHHFRAGGAYRSRVTPA